MVKAKCIASDVLQQKYSQLTANAIRPPNLSNVAIFAHQMALNVCRETSAIVKLAPNHFVEAMECVVA
jgi:hypothetical protein